MIRRLLCCFISISLVSVQTHWASAMPIQTRTELEKFIQQTGLISRSTSWEKIFKHTNVDLPIDLQNEILKFQKEFASAEMPKASLIRMGQGANERLLLEWKKTGQRVSLEIYAQKDRFAVLKNSFRTQKGYTQKFELVLTEKDLKDPLLVMRKITGQENSNYRYPHVQLLTAEQIKKLGARQRQIYIDRLRETLVLAEKLQNQGAEGQRTSLFRHYMNVFYPEAQASPEGSCIVAGWVGQYNANSCQAPASSVQTNCVKCNPEIYGSEAPCLAILDNKKLPKNATEICNQKTESNKYQVFQGVKSSQDVLSKKQDLQGVLTNLRQKCGEIQEGVSQNKKLSDQSTTCAQLNTRISDLESVNCELLKKQPESFAGLSCSQDRIDEKQGGEGRESDGKEDLLAKDEGDKTAKDDKKAGEGCRALPAESNQLKCMASQIRSISCDNEEGEVKKRYFCECGADEDAYFSNTPKPVICEAKRLSRSETKERDRYRSRYSKKKDSSFFQPWMLTAGAGALGILLYYFMSRQMLKQQYQYYNTSPVATPVPVYATPTPVPTPVILTPGTTGTR